MANKYNKALHTLVNIGKAGGLSAKEARRYAQSHLQEYLQTLDKQTKLFNALQESALRLDGLLPEGGKEARNVPHMKTRTKQESNACLADTRGKHRSKVVYGGQKTEGPAIISRKAGASARKEREKNRKWDIGTLARLDAQAERREDCKEHAKAREVMRIWHETNYGKKRKVIC